MQVKALAVKTKEWPVLVIWEMKRVLQDKQEDFYLFICDHEQESCLEQKVATACKMKSQRDNLPRPNCDSDGKADNKRQAFINTDTRHFKIHTGNMWPPWHGLKYGAENLQLI